jgi:hypothetical protein
VNSWKEYQERLPKEQEVADWWQRWPDANVAIVCGPVSEGLAVLDIDDRELAEAMAADAGLQAETTLVRTPSDGLHVYTIETEGTSPSGPLVPGLADLKAAGGYVLAPPSGIDGREYVYLTNNGIMRVPKAKGWALELLATYGFEMPESKTSSKRLDTAEILEGLPEGERDDALFRLACKLRRTDVPREMTERLILEAAAKCSPPFSEREALEKVASAYRRYPSSDTIPNSHPYIERESGIAVVEAAQMVEPGPRRWRVQDFLPDGFPAILHGDGGQGKSFLGLAMGSCVVAGLPFLGEDVVRGPVLYLGWELDGDEFSRRAYQIARGLGFDKPPSGLLYGKAAAPLAQILDDVRSHVLARGVGLVVVDSLGPACGGDTQSERLILPTMGALRSLGASVLCIDHQSKMQQGQDYGQKTPYGSAYKFNLARAVWQIERGERREDGVLDLLLRHRKANFASLSADMGVQIVFDGPTVRLHRVNPSDVPGLADKLPAREQAWAALQDAEGVTVEELVGTIGRPEKTVRNILTALRKEGRAASEGGRWRAIPNSRPYIERESGIVSEDELPATPDVCATCGAPVEGYTSDGEPRCHEHTEVRTW